MGLPHPFLYSLFREASGRGEASRSGKPISFDKSIRPSDQKFPHFPCAASTYNADRPALPISRILIYSWFKAKRLLYTSDAYGLSLWTAKYFPMDREIVFPSGDALRRPPSHSHSPNIASQTPRNKSHRHTLPNIFLRGKYIHLPTCRSVPKASQLPLNSPS